jgi:phospholipase/lecithinase/hemolysin
MMMSCPDASKYVYWDTVHTTQHTNQIVAAYLMNTTFSALAA